MLGKSISFCCVMRNVMSRHLMIRGVASIMIGVFLFAPLSYNIPALIAYVIAGDTLTIDRDTTWTGDMDLSRYGAIFVQDDARLTIEPGTHLVIPHILIVDTAHIIAQGTAQKPITMTQVDMPPRNGDDCPLPPRGMLSFMLSREEGILLPTSYFSHVIFDGLGLLTDCNPGPIMVHKDVAPSLINGAYAQKPAPPLAQDYDIYRAPAVWFESGRVSMDHCVFTNSKDRDVLVDMDIDEMAQGVDFLRITNSDFLGSAEHIAVQSRVRQIDDYYSFFGSCMEECDAQYSQHTSMVWWEREKLCTQICTLRAESNEEFFDDTVVQLTGNWYGHTGGPDRSYEGWKGRGMRVFGNVTVKASRAEPNIVHGSNVLFLPGIKASKLYKRRGFVGEDTLWPPNYFLDVNDLMLDGNGKSLDGGIFTENVLDETIGGNLYKSFLGDLSVMKEEGEIMDYVSYAYDWRDSVDDIARFGSTYRNGERKNPVEEVKRLAQSSFNKKVTIVAHSNGGLLAKAVMQELERQNKADLVDNIILVGSPQMGTPKAVGALLHGFDEQLPIPGLMSDFQARTFGENMPGAYGLLPSREYFRRTKDPLINFSADAMEPYTAYRATYGDAIDDVQEFDDFLLGAEGDRDKPKSTDTVSANVLNHKLVRQARALHDDLDAWTPPEHVRVIQLAGWGLDTVRGFTYTQKTKTECVPNENAHPFESSRECRKVTRPIVEPRYTVDGDGTVTAPSALMLDNTDRVDRYWVDLWTQTSLLKKQKKHSNILEAESVRNFVNETITKHHVPEKLPPYILRERPEDKKKMKNPHRIRMALYSPLDIHLYDQHGNHTGPTTVTVDGREMTTIETRIPNSYYDVFGDQKYVGWGGDSDVRIVLDGYDKGVYTLTLQEVSVTDYGEKQGDHITLADLPTTENTTAHMTVSGGTLDDVTSLAADYDGDGAVDYTVQPRKNGIARLTGSLEEDAQPMEKTQQNNTSAKTVPTSKKASIDRWTAVRRTAPGTKCPEKLDITLFGKHFDKDAVVRIGGTKAKKLVHYNSKKVKATFCMTDLQSVKTGPLRSITAQNPDTKADKAIRKIDINDFVIK